MNTVATATEDISQAAQNRPSDAIKAPARPRQRANEGSPVKWPLNSLYGLGRDEHQYIIYKAVKATSANKRRGSHQFRPVAYHPDLEGALMWVIKRQVFFDDDPTISMGLLDAFQAFCHHLDRVKADIAALAERIEAGLVEQQTAPQ